MKMILRPYRESGDDRMFALYMLGNENPSYVSKIENCFSYAKEVGIEILLERGWENDELMAKNASYLKRYQER